MVLSSNNNYNAVFVFIILNSRVFTTYTVLFYHLVLFYCMFIKTVKTRSYEDGACIPGALFQLPVHATTSGSHCFAI